MQNNAECRTLLVSKSLPVANSNYANGLLSARKGNCHILSSGRLCVFKQDAADICKLSVTNALPVYGERSLSKILSAEL